MMSIGEKTVIRTRIYWRKSKGEPQEILGEANCLTFRPGFVGILMPQDRLLPSEKRKVRYYPADLIEAVEETEIVEVPREGYREENSFREHPGSAPVTAGVGSMPVGEK